MKKIRMSIQGMEQLLYPGHSSLNSAAGGLILHRTGVHLQPKPDPKPKAKSKSKLKPKRPKAKPKPKPLPKPLPKPDLSKTDSHSDSLSDMCFVPESNDYWDTDLECYEFDPALWQYLAVLALKYYHEKQGAELGLNGGISAFPLHIWGGVSFHLAFEANDSTGSPKKIFAEVYRYDKSEECKVLFCDIMDPKDPDLLKGCRYCSTKVLHPKGMEFFKPPYEW